MMVCFYVRQLELKGRIPDRQMDELITSYTTMYGQPQFDHDLLGMYCSVDLSIFYNIFGWPLGQVFGTMCRLLTSSVMHVLWQNRRSKRNIYYTINYPGLMAAAITVCTKLPRVDCSVRYSSVTVACMGLQSLWEIAIFSRLEVGRWVSDIGGIVSPP